MSAESDIESDPDALEGEGDDAAMSVHSDTTYDDDDVTDDVTPDQSAGGMADAMARLLARTVPGGARGPILCRAKTERELAARKRRLGEGAGEGAGGSDGEDASGEEGIVKEDRKEDRKEEMKENKAQLHSATLLKRKQWEELGRVRPSTMDREVEKNLQRIATKGVVQLFNAVRKQQQQGGQEDTERGRKRDKQTVTAKARTARFLDLLQPISVKLKQKSGEEVKQEMKVEQDEATWSVLREDFMMGGSMRDWDRQTDS